MDSLPHPLYLCNIFNLTYSSQQICSLRSTQTSPSMPHYVQRHLNLLFCPLLMLSLNFSEPFSPHWLFWWISYWEFYLTEWPRWAWCLQKISTGNLSHRASAHTQAARTFGHISPWWLSHSTAGIWTHTCPYRLDQLLKYYCITFITF